VPGSTVVLVVVGAPVVTIVAGVTVVVRAAVDVVVVGAGVAARASLAEHPASTSATTTNHFTAGGYRRPATSHGPTMGAVSVSVSLERLRDEVARYGAHPFILTVSDGGRPHAVAATVAWEGDQLVGGCGRSTAANASARPDISFLWPPLEPEGYSLIVDGLAAVDDQQIRLSPSRAVLHRSAPSPDPLKACSSDCVTVLQ
jgi:hypothetical protein